MSLSIVSTPIGHPDDITTRALEALRTAELVIGEERKALTRTLKAYQLTPKPIELLNEHSAPEDIQHLGELCKNMEVALISDCGTPSFCDPGFQLVRWCRRHDVAIRPLPGASSLMTLLSMVSVKTEKFLFAGFLPRDGKKRIRELESYRNLPFAVAFMDTPYRLQKTLSDLKKHLPNRRALIGLDQTKENELYIEDKTENLISTVPYEKAEFIILLYP